MLFDNPIIAFSIFQDVVYLILAKTISVISQRIFLTKLLYKDPHISSFDIYSILLPNFKLRSFFLFFPQFPSLILFMVFTIDSKIVSRLVLINVSSGIILQKDQFWKTHDRCIKFLFISQLSLELQSDIKFCISTFARKLNLKFKISDWLLLQKRSKIKNIFKRIIHIDRVMMVIVMAK